MLELIGIVLGLIGIYLGWIALTYKQKQEVKEKVKNVSKVFKTEEAELKDYEANLIRVALDGTETEYDGERGKD